MQQQRFDSNLTCCDMSALLAFLVVLLLGAMSLSNSTTQQQVRPLLRQSPFAPLKELHPWSDEELQQLTALRREGAYDWATIAQKVGRSASACSQKYASICGGTSRTLSSIEQKCVLRLVVMHGENWRLISAAMRAGRVVRGGALLLSDERYSEENLKYFFRRYMRSFVSGPWTADEITLLKRLVLENLENPVLLGMERGGAEQSSGVKDGQGEAWEGGDEGEGGGSLDGLRNSLASLKAMIYKGAEDGEVLAFIESMRSSVEVSAGVSSNSSSIDSYDLGAIALGGDSDYFRVYAQRSPPCWRNISHILMRSSVDCRRAYLSSVLRRDVSQQRDVWYPGEAYFLQQLTLHWNRSWAAIGHELGRSAHQCRNAYAAGAGPAVLRVREDGCSPAADSIYSFHRLGRKSRSWTDAEDAELRRLQLEHANRWSVIAAAMQRSNSQCYQRYEILAARTNDSTPRGWTDEQNTQLFALVQSEGAQWTAIGRRLGRTAYVCRAAYKRLLDRSRAAGGVALPAMPRHRARRQLDAQLQIADGAPRLSRAWTREEDAYLKSLVDSAGRRWSSIAEEMNRSPEDIMLRFDFKIAPRKMGQWTREEDRQLLQLHAKLGPRWAKIGEFIGRTGPQCAMRYRVTLDPRLKWRLWSPDEDDQMLALREGAGYSWPMISAVLGRAASSVRYRYYKLKAN